MAEVGVLQLTIEDNSESAATGLSHLATALEKVQDAVKGGLSGLNGAAKNIEKIGKAVDDSLSGSTFEKLKQFSESLQGLKDVDLSGVSKAIKSVGEESGNPGKQISESLVAGIEEGMSKVDLLREKVGILRGEMDEGIDKETFDDKRIVNYALQIANLEEQIGRLEEVERRVGDAEQWTKFSEEFSTIDAYAMKLSALREKLSEGINSGKWDNEKIANAVLKIQSLEERIEKLKELQSDGVLKTTNEEAIQAANNFLSASTNIDLLKQKLDAMKAEMGQGILSGAWDEKKLSSYAIQVQNLEEKIRKLSAAAEEAKPNLDGVTEVTGDPGSAFNEVEASVEGAASSTGTLSDGMVEVEASVEAATGSAHRFSDALETIVSKAKSAWNSLTETRDGVNGLKGAFSAMFPTLSSFASGLSRIAKYRFIRTVIKQITSGMSEGIKNVYYYSKAIGSSFAPSMDDAASSLLQMKNSIGASLAPMIQSLIPYLQTIVNWFITLINYVNQFISLLRGQATWTRATKASASAYDDVTKSAKGASAAVKDLLADWDELNIIQSESGSSGTGTGTDAMTNYLKMFEEVSDYEDWIENLVDGIKDQFGDIWTLVKKIAVAILGWKLSSAFSGILGTIGGLVSAGMIIDLVFNITQLLDKQYFKTGDIGWVVADVLQTALGAYLANKVVKKVLGAGAGKVAAGVTLAVSAVSDIIALVGAKDVTALSTEGIVTELKSGLKLGAGFFMFEKAAGIPTGEALLAAGEVASIGIGAAIGIKAIATYADTGEMTLDRIKELVTGAGVAGVGVTFFELMSGAGIAAAVTAGGAVALALGVAFAAAVGVVALVNLLDDDGIQWGEKKLTAEQVESFVNQKTFTVDVPTTVKVISDTVDTTGVKRSTIETELTRALGTFKVIQLGLASDQDYAQLKIDILGDESTGAKGLIGTIDDYVQEAKDVGKLTLQFTPSLVGSDQSDASEWFGNYTTGWDKVNEYATNKGKTIGEMLSKGESEAIIDGEKVTLSSLMKQLTDVTSAVTRAKVNSAAFGELQFNLGDLSQASFDDITTKFAEYKNNLTEEYKKWINEQYTLQGELVAALLEIDPNAESEETKKAVAYYKYMGEHLMDSVNDEVKKAAQPGLKMLTDFLAEKYASVAPELAEAWNMYTSDFGEFNPFAWLNDPDSADFTGMDAKQAAEQITKDLTEQLGGINEDLGKYIETLGLNPFDFLTADMQEQMKQYILTAFDPDTADEILKYVLPEYRQAMEEELNNQQPFSGFEYENEVDVHTTVNDTVETVTEDVSEGTTELPTGGQAAVDEYNAQAAELTATAAEVEQNVNTLTLDNLTFDTTDAQRGANQAASAIEDMASRIKAAFQSLEGLGFEFSVGSADQVLEKMNAAIHVTIPAAASGALFKSGDIFSANENGKTELIGSYGNKTAVMNNDQVVGAVTNGVAAANSGVESRLSSIETMMMRILNKEFTAKAVPSTGWGSLTAKSAAQYSRVTG